MSFKIEDTRLSASGGGTQVASDRRHSTGRNGHFDLVMVKQSSGAYDLEVFMKLQFYFNDGDPSAQGWANAAAVNWTDPQKTSFMTNWHSEVRGAWTKSNVGTLSDGGQLNVQFNFQIREGGIMWDHFEIEVTKIPATGFEQSYVSRAFIDGDVQLDSNDLKPKSTGQLAAVHEFGHMIGLPDEYPASSPHAHDSGSIMHGGTTVRLRQYDHFISWADANK